MSDIFVLFVCLKVYNSCTVVCFTSSPNNFFMSESCVTVMFSLDSFPIRMASDSFVSYSFMRKQETDGHFCACPQEGSSKHFFKRFNEGFVATVNFCSWEQLKLTKIWKPHLNICLCGIHIQYINCYFLNFLHERFYNSSVCLVNVLNESFYKIPVKSICFMIGSPETLSSGFEYKPVWNLILRLKLFWMDILNSDLFFQLKGNRMDLGLNCSRKWLSGLFAPIVDSICAGSHINNNFSFVCVWLVSYLHYKSIANVTRMTHICSRTIEIHYQHESSIGKNFFLM